MRLGTIVSANSDGTYMDETGVRVRPIGNFSPAVGDRVQINGSYMYGHYVGGAASFGTPGLEGVPIHWQTEDGSHFGYIDASGVYHALTGGASSAVQMWCNNRKHVYVLSLDHNVYDAVTKTVLFTIPGDAIPRDMAAELDNDQVYVLYATGSANTEAYYLASKGGTEMLAQASGGVVVDVSGLVNMFHGVDITDWYKKGGGKNMEDDELPYDLIYPDFGFKDKPIKMADMPAPKYDNMAQNLDVLDFTLDMVDTSGHESGYTLRSVGAANPDFVHSSGAAQKATLYTQIRAFLDTTTTTGLVTRQHGYGLLKTIARIAEGYGPSYSSSTVVLANEQSKDDKPETQLDPTGLLADQSSSVLPFPSKPPYSMTFPYGSTLTRTGWSTSQFTIPNFGIVFSGPWANQGIYKLICPLPGETAYLCGVSRGGTGQPGLASTERLLLVNADGTSEPLGAEGSINNTTQTRLCYMTDLPDNLGDLLSSFSYEDES